MKHLLIVDDDITFRTIVTRFAKEKNIQVTVCGSLFELSLLTKVGQFDAVVMDYYLDNIQQFISGADAASAFGATPVLLISSTVQCIEVGAEWPSAIRKFVHKKVGAQRIIEEALLLTQP